MGSSHPDTNHAPLRRPKTDGERGVIPTGQVVILKERELDCDVATAIARLRAEPETAHSRILVVAPDDGPEEDGAVESLPRPRTPTTVAQAARIAQTAALGEVGRRFELLAACLRRFSLESSDVIRGLPGGQVSEPVRQLGEIQSWSDAVLADLEREASAAREGLQPLRSHDLLAEMVRQVEVQYPGVRVQLDTQGAELQCWGRAADVAEALFLATALVALRIGGRGGITVELDATDGLVRHRILGNGEPFELDAPAAVERFRQLVRRNGGHIAQDAPSEGVGAGLVVSLPKVG